MSGWETGQKLQNGYIIERVLGRGGLSCVYLVQRLIDGEYLALKTLDTSTITYEGALPIFFNELRTWMDLPEHPNITPCRFFKTIEGKLSIFAEFISGGTLLDWIKQKKLITLKDILDVAIQCAWALQTAHDHGVIHQDVKPANILMTENGIPRLTDFGISFVMPTVQRIHQPERVNGATDSSRTGGFTLAYCSPEQFKQEAVDFSTDIWSYGIVLSYMLTGKLFTDAGYLAQESLNYDLQVHNPPYPPIPVSIIQLLQRCFKDDPAERWRSFNDIAGLLMTAYEHEIGEPYPRSRPAVRSIARSRSFQEDRRLTITGLKWDDPVGWLEKAYDLSGWDKTEMEQLLNQASFSPRTQALTDLEMYEAALDIFQAAAVTGEADIELQLAELLMNKSLVHEMTSDWKGAVNARDETIRIMERHIYSGQHTELANDLAAAYTKQGWLLVRMGELRRGINYYDKALELRSALVHQQGRNDLLSDLAKIYMSKGLAMQHLKRLHQAQSCMDQAIRIMEDIIASTGSAAEFRQRMVVYYINRALLGRLRNDYSDAQLYLKKADTLMGDSLNFAQPDDNAAFLAKFEHSRAVIELEFGNYPMAFKLLNSAIKRLEHAVYKQNRTELKGRLAEVYQDKARALKATSETRDANLFFDEAIRLMEQLVYKEGAEEQGRNLALLYLNKARTLDELEIWEPAFRFYEKSIRLFKWLVEENGQNELKEELVQAYIHQAAFFRRREDYHTVVHIYQPVVETLRELIYNGSNKQLLGDLAKARCYLAEALLLTGQRRAAEKHARDGLILLKEEIKRSPGPELQNVLKWAKHRFKTLVDMAALKL